MKMKIISKQHEEIEQALDKLVKTLAGKQDELQKHNAFAMCMWQKKGEDEYLVEIQYILANPATDFILKHEFSKTLRQIDNDVKIE